MFPFLVTVQEGNLVAIEGASSRFANVCDGIQGIHAAFNERDGHQDRCSSNPRNAMNSDASILFGRIEKHFIVQFQPSVDHFFFWRSSILKFHVVVDLDAKVGERSWVVRTSFADADQVSDLVLLEDWKVGMQGCIGWTVEDQKVELPDTDRADADTRHVVMRAESEWEMRWSQARVREGV